MRPSAPMVVLLFLISLPLPARSQQSWKWCRPDGEYSTVSLLQRTLAAVDSTGAKMRHVYELTPTSPDSVVLIRDERICKQASLAYYRGSLGPPRSVVVARVTNRYAVQ